MHILSVEVKDRSYSREKGRHEATLLVAGHENRVSFRAAARLAESSGVRDVTQGLLADALRQLRRLPEYRNTTREITVAADALSA